MPARGPLPWIVVVPVAMLLAAAQPPHFRGCRGDSDPGDDTPLPIAEGETCGDDLDCPPDACMDVRCLAGTCVAVAMTIDRDLDGDSPPPCGGDCDDTDPTRFRGAREQCDGVDEDCDGTVDEGAPSRDQSFVLGGGDPGSTVVPWGDGFLVTEQATGLVLVTTLTPAGTTGPPRELMRLTGGSRFAGVSAVAAADGRALFVAWTDLGQARYLVAEPSDTGAISTLEGPASLAAPGRVQQVVLAEHAGGFAIGLDVLDDEEHRTRHVMLDPMAAETIEVPLVGDPERIARADWFGLASDGALVAATDEASTIYFFEPDGALAGQQELPDLAYRSLASWDGDVVAGYQDDFGLQLVHVSVDGVGEAQPGPSVGATRWHLWRVGDAIAVARDGGSPTAWLLDGTLRTYLHASLTLGSGSATRVGVAHSSAATVFLSAFEDPRVEARILTECGP